MLLNERNLTTEEILQIETFLAEQHDLDEDDSVTIGGGYASPTGMPLGYRYPYGISVEVMYRRYFEEVDHSKITPASISIPTIEGLGELEIMEVWILSQPAASLMTVEFNAMPTDGNIFEAGKLWGNVRRQEMGAVERCLNYVTREYGDLEL